MKIFKIPFIFCCLSITQLAWAAEPDENAAKAIADAELPAITLVDIATDLPEQKQLQIVHKELPGMIQQCFGRVGQFADNAIIQQPPAELTPENLIYNVLANYIKFSVWGSQRYELIEPTVLEGILENLSVGNFDEFYNEGEFYRQLGVEKLIWLKSDERGIELMGRILELYYEKDEIEDLHERIQEAVSGCKIYARQSKLFDQLNEIKIHETVKGLVNEVDTAYRLKDLVRDREAVMYLLDKSKEVFDQEATCIQKGTKEQPENFVVLGDLHGDFYSLSAVLAKYAKDVAAGRLSLVFLGDYVDRGPHSLEVMLTLLSLKHAYPGRILMQVGNHENKSFYMFQFMEELLSKAQQGTDDEQIEEDIYSITQMRQIQPAKGIVSSINDLGLSNPFQQGEYQRVFQCLPNTEPEYVPADGTITGEITKRLFGVYDSLPLYMVLNGSIFCVHAAPPIPEGANIDNFNIIEYINSNASAVDRENALWSDITSAPGKITKNTDRGAGQLVSSWTIEQLLKNSGLEALMRGHYHIASCNDYGEKIYNVITTMLWEKYGEFLCQPFGEASIVEISQRNCEKKAVHDLVPAEIMEDYIEKQLGPQALQEAKDYLTPRED